LTAAVLLAAISAITACAAARGLCAEVAAYLRLRPPIAGRSLLSSRLRAWVRTAGRRSGVGSRKLLALKASCAAVGAAMAMTAAAASPSRLTMVLMLFAPIACFHAPDLYAARRERRRLGEVVRDLPDMLDLLRVAVEAGMPPARALGAVAAQFDGPLAVEWRRVAAEVALGATVEEALASLADRLPAAEVAFLVEALGRAHRLGAPLRHVLAAQASRARHRRRQHVREQAARAGPKIQLVVALLLVPSVLLLVAAGILAELQRSGLLLPV
jgi:tight adherence protein C